MQRQTQRVRGPWALVPALPFGIFLLSSSAFAIPPAQPFPAAVSPADGTSLPENGRVLLFSGDAVSLEEIGLVAAVDGATVEVAASLIGCCTVAVDFAAPPSGATNASLFVSGPRGDFTYGWTIAPPDLTVPSVGVVEIVQVVTATRLTAPMTPRDGPAWVLTLDVAEVADDVGVAALSTFDDTGALVTIEPPSGRTYERLLTGVAGDRTEACIVVEVRDAAGNAVTSPPACTDLPSHDAREEAGDTDAGGCASVTAPSFLALAVLALALRRRVHVTASLLATGVLAAGCAGPSVDAEEPAGPCNEGFVDHTFPAASFDDAFFDEHARPQYGWRALKLLVIHPLDEDRRLVALFDDDFYSLHDQWFFFRLMNGVPACGADEIAPVVDGEPFATVQEILDWAEAQERLPPFLSWREDRLIAPDFYRLARDTEPRVYAPAYLTRDVDGEPTAYAVRVAGPDAIEARELRALFDALDPLMPAGSPLYWTPSRSRPAHIALVEELEREDDPMAARVRWQ